MKSKYKITSTNRFKKSYHKMLKQGYNENDFIKVLSMLANDEQLPVQYRNHLLEPKKNRRLGVPYKA